VTLQNGVVNVNGGRISQACVLDHFARRSALSFEGVSQNVRLTAFRRQTRTQAKQFATGDLLFSL